MWQKTSNDKYPSSYISIIKVNGVPILPPLITPERRKELQLYKQQALKIEKRLEIQRNLREYIQNFENSILQNKRNAEDLSENSRDALKTNTFYTNTLNGNSLNENSLNADSLNANYLNANTFNANTSNANTVNANTFNANTLNANTFNRDFFNENTSNGDTTSSTSNINFQTLAPGNNSFTNVDTSELRNYMSCSALKKNSQTSPLTIEPQTNFSNYSKLSPNKKPAQTYNGTSNICENTQNLSPNSSGDIQNIISYIPEEYSGDIQNIISYIPDNIPNLVLSTHKDIQNITNLNDFISNCKNQSKMENDSKSEYKRLHINEESSKQFENCKGHNTKSKIRYENQSIESILNQSDSDESYKHFESSKQLESSKKHESSKQFESSKDFESPYEINSVNTPQYPNSQKFVTLKTDPDSLSSSFKADFDCLKSNNTLKTNQNYTQSSTEASVKKQAMILKSVLLGKPTKIQPMDESILKPLKSLTADTSSPRNKAFKCHIHNDPSKFATSTPDKTVDSHLSNLNARESLEYIMEPRTFKIPVQTSLEHQLAFGDCDDKGTNVQSELSCHVESFDYDAEHDKVLSPNTQAYSGFNSLELETIIEKTPSKSNRNEKPVHQTELNRLRERSNSFTVNSPSPALLAHLKKHSIDNPLGSYDAKKLENLVSSEQISKTTERNKDKGSDSQDFIEYGHPVSETSLETLLGYNLKEQNIPSLSQLNCSEKFLPINSESDSVLLMVRSDESLQMKPKESQVNYETVQDEKQSQVNYETIQDENQLALSEQNIGEVLSNNFPGREVEDAPILSKDVENKLRELLQQIPENYSKTILSLFGRKSSDHSKDDINQDRSNISKNNDNNTIEGCNINRNQSEETKCNQVNVIQYNSIQYHSIQVNPQNTISNNTNQNISNDTNKNISNDTNQNISNYKNMSNQNISIDKNMSNDTIQNISNDKNKIIPNDDRKTDDLDECRFVDSDSHFYDATLNESDRFSSQTLYYTMTSSSDTLNGVHTPTALEEYLEHDEKMNEEISKLCRSISDYKCALKKEWKVDDARFAVMNKASSIIGAATRGFLTRRLMRTERVQSLKATIRDALLCAVKLHAEDKEKIQPADVELHRRLIKQVSAAIYEFHEIFIELPVKDQMQIIAADRQRLLEKLRRPSSSRRSLTNRSRPTSASKVLKRTSSARRS